MSRGRKVSVVAAVLVVAALGGQAAAQPGTLPGGGGQSDGRETCAAGSSCAGITWITDTFGLVGGDQTSDCVTRTAGNDPREGHLAATDSLRPDCGEDEIPRPPSPAEVLATCPAPPTPTLGHDPTANQFLTGLETRFWTTAPTAATTATIRGYPTRCALTPTSFTFDAGDPHATTFNQQPIHTTTAPGGPHPHHAFAYTYERTGTATPTVAATYTATLTYGGPTATAITTGTAATTTSDTVTMPILQVRGAMTTDET